MQHNSSSVRLDLKVSCEQQLSSLAPERDLGLESDVSQSSIIDTSIDLFYGREPPSKDFLNRNQKMIMIAAKTVLHDRKICCTTFKNGGMASFVMTMIVPFPTFPGFPGSLCA